ncbi:MAG: hypothetical protein ACREXR_17025, partial [Gammaproteobacteria bacterium]
AQADPLEKLLNAPLRVAEACPTCRAPPRRASPMLRHPVFCRFSPYQFCSTSRYSATVGRPDASISLA